MKTPSAMITQEKKNNQCLEDPNKSHLVFSSPAVGSPVGVRETFLSDPGLWVGLLICFCL